MTNLDDLIDAERKRAALKIAKLKRVAAEEQRRVDERVVPLLREDKPELYESLATRATDALAAEKAKRSLRAKTAASPVPTVLSPSVPQASEHAREEAASWNG